MSLHWAEESSLQHGLKVEGGYIEVRSAEVLVAAYGQQWVTGIGRRRFPPDHGRRSFMKGELHTRIFGRRQWRRAVGTSNTSPGHSEKTQRVQAFLLAAYSWKVKKLLPMVTAFCSRHLGQLFTLFILWLGQQETLNFSDL